MHVHRCTRSSSSIWQTRWFFFYPCWILSAGSRISPIQFIPSFTLGESFTPTLISVSFNSAPYLPLPPLPFSSDITFWALMKKKKKNELDWKSCTRLPLCSPTQHYGLMQVQESCHLNHLGLIFTHDLHILTNANRLGTVAQTLCLISIIIVIKQHKPIVTGVPSTFIFNQSWLIHFLSSANANANSNSTSCLNV